MDGSIQFTVGDIVLGGLVKETLAQYVMILFLTRCVSRRFGSRDELKSLGPMLAGLMFVTSLTVCSAQQRPGRVVTPPNQISELVTFPRPEVEFIIGPQLKIGSKLNPHPWFDRTQLARGAVHGREFPKFPPMQLTGKVQVTTRTATVRGVGTKFLSEVDPSGPAPFFNGRFRVFEDGKTWRDVQVLTVQSDTQLTLTAPYTYATQTGAQADTFFNQEGSGWNSDIYMNANYYDLALCLYALYYRTGDPTYLTYARKVADSWWLSPQIKGGTARSFDTFSYSPRSASLGGLILRALDGRPEMWDWLQAYTRYMFDNWVKQRLADPTPFNGIRDGSYMLLYATWLAKVLPDSFPLQAGGSAGNGAGLRAAFLADAETAAINYGRLQYPDGSWRWDDGYYKDADGGQLRGIMQPFMVGLLMQALIEVHRLTMKAQARSAVRLALAKACEHLYDGGPYMKDQLVPSLPGIRIRAFNYFYHGGTTVNPKKYLRGDYVGYDTSAVLYIKSARQSTSTILPAYGYVYAITGDERFKKMGDELFESAFGDVTDRLHNEADGSAKNYNQNYRMGGRYLAWRIGAQSWVTNTTPSPLMESVTPPSKLEPVSPVSTLFAMASNLAPLPNLDEAQLIELVGQIEQARKAFAAQKAQYTSPESVLEELQVALDHAQTVLAMLRTQAGYSDDARIRLGWMAARLKRANDRVKPK